MSIYPAASQFTLLPELNAFGRIFNGVCSGAEWYTNQNNFYRQVRNFVIDITRLSPSGGQSCIHWQVAQATSLQNIVFKMVQGGTGNNQMGIFMENGSGGMPVDINGLSQV
jgi:glucan 1,3-beta-glucosidase